MSPFRLSFRLSARIDRGPVGILGAPLLVPLPLLCALPFCALPFCGGPSGNMGALDFSKRFRSSSASFRLVSSASLSRSAFGMNLGFAAAASSSRFALRMSSMLGGCFLWTGLGFFVLVGAERGAMVGAPSSSGCEADIMASQVVGDGMSGLSATQDNIRRGAESDALLESARVWCCVLSTRQSKVEVMRARRR